MSTTESPVEAPRLDLSPYFYETSLPAETVVAVTRSFVEQSNMKPSLRKEAHQALERIITLSTGVGAVCLPNTEQFLGALVDACGGRADHALNTLAIMEHWGFGQLSWVETLEFVQAATAMLNWGEAVPAIRHLMKMPIWKRCGHMFRFMAELYGWRPGHEQPSIGTPLGNSAQLQLVTKLFQSWNVPTPYAAYTSPHGVKVGIPKLWMMIKEANRRRVSCGRIAQLADATDIQVVDNLLRYIVNGYLNARHLKAICSDASIVYRMDTFDQLVAVCNAWEPFKNDLSLVDFFALGGTKDDYDAWKMLHEEQRRHTLERQRLSLPEPKTERTKFTGLKRHHPNYRKREQATGATDFPQLMEKLELEDLFPDLNIPFARAILLCGFLREGNRLITFAASPHLNENRLWRMCRQFLPDVSSPRRVFAATLQDMVSKRLVRAQGGRYHVKIPDEHRFPLAHKVMARISRIIHEQ